MFTLTGSDSPGPGLLNHLLFDADDQTWGLLHALLLSCTPSLIIFWKMSKGDGDLSSIQRLNSLILEQAGP